jgi:hypothetical protein
LPLWNNLICQNRKIKLTKYIPDKTTKIYVCISVHFLLNSSFIIFFSFIKTCIFICKRKKNYHVYVEGFQQLNRMDVWLNFMTLEQINVVSQFCGSYHACTCNTFWNCYSILPQLSMVMSIYRHFHQYN